MDSRELIEAEAHVFKALGHPARLTMVQALAEGPRCVCDLVGLVPSSQATTSRHLDVLLNARIVRRRREGTRMIYELSMPCVLKLVPCVLSAIRKQVESEAKLLKE